MIDAVANPMKNRVGGGGATKKKRQKAYLAKVQLLPASDLHNPQTPQRQEIKKASIFCRITPHHPIQRALSTLAHKAQQSGNVEP